MLRKEWKENPLKFIFVHTGAVIGLFAVDGRQPVGPAGR